MKNFMICVIHRILSYKNAESNESDVDGIKAHGEMKNS